MLSCTRYKQFGIVWRVFLLLARLHPKFLLRVLWNLALQSFRTLRSCLLHYTLSNKFVIRHQIYGDWNGRANRRLCVNGRIQTLTRITLSNLSLASTSARRESPDLSTSCIPPLYGYEDASFRVSGNNEVKIVGGSSRSMPGLGET